LTRVHGIRRHLVGAPCVLFLCLGHVASGLAGSVSPMVLSLDRCVALALQKNRDALIAEEELMKAKAQITEARSGALPTLRLDGQYIGNWKLPEFVVTAGELGRQSFRIGTRHTFTGSVTLQQPLYVGGKIGAALKVSHLYSELSEEHLQSTQQEIIFTVESAFYAVLLAREMVTVSQAAVDQAYAHLERVRQFYSEGTVSEYDVLRAEVQVSNLKPGLITAQNGLDLAEAALKHVVGIDLETPVLLEGGFHAEQREKMGDEDRLTQAALVRRPEIRQVDLEIQMRQQAVAIAKADLKPSLFLFTGGQLQAQIDRLRLKRGDWIDSWNTGLALEFPLFDGWRTSGHVNQARAELLQAEYRRDQLEDRVRMQVKEAVLNLKRAKEKIEAQSKTVEQAERGLHIAEVRYGNGISTQLEVMDAQLALTQARTNHAEALYEYSIASAALDRAVGTIGTDYLEGREE